MREANPTVARAGPMQRRHRCNQKDTNWYENAKVTEYLLGRGWYRSEFEGNEPERRKSDRLEPER